MALIHLRGRNLVVVGLEVSSHCIQVKLQGGRQQVIESYYPETNAEAAENLSPAIFTPEQINAVVAAYPIGSERKYIELDEDSWNQVKALLDPILEANRKAQEEAEQAEPGNGEESPADAESAESIVS